MQKKTISLNMGPQHPSTHGVLRLKLELDGEIVKDIQPIIGYLHTGIEKNTEKHMWQQAITDVTRMDYVSNISHEAAYCLAVEKALKIVNKIPKKANIIRVLFLEMSRIASHLAAIGTGGNDMGGTTLMTMSFQAREQIMLFFEAVSGLRMNNEFFRIGGVSNDIPLSTLNELEKNIKLIKRGINELDKLLSGNPIWKARSKGIGLLSLNDCIKFGITGPVLRSAGCSKDLRKTNPYLDYESYDFDIAYTDTADSWGRYLIRLEEMRQSIKIVKQCISRLTDVIGDEYMVSNLPVSTTYKLSVDSDGQGQDPKNVIKFGYSYETVKQKDKNLNSSENVSDFEDSSISITKTSKESMEHLITHFKYVTEGFNVANGTTFQMVECARGIVAATVVSNGKNKPHRVHFTDASFTNLQALKKMCVGQYLSDVVVSLASLDPVLGSVDR